MTAKVDLPSTGAPATTADAADPASQQQQQQLATEVGDTTAAAASPLARSLSSPTKSNKSTPKNAPGATGAHFGKTMPNSFVSLSPQHADMPQTPSQTSFVAMGPDASHTDAARRGSHFDLDFTKRDSVNNIRREVEAVQQQSTTFFHRDFDKDIHVFTEVPEVKVLGGRSEEAWPTRYVEYDVELHYKNFKWQVEIPKSTLYGLWFFIKSQFNIKFPHAAATAGTSQPAHGATSSHYTAASNWPQMRKLFLATADKSVSPEMIALIQQYLDAVVRVPRLLSSSYVVSMFQVSNSTFDDDEGYTSVREGWLKVRIWLKGNTENVRINRGAVTCDNECFNCMCVVKRVSLKSKKWRWVALKHSSIAVFPSLQDTKAADAFLFDHKFSIERGIHSAGSNTALLVSNSTYVLQLEAKTKQSILKWANAIRKVAEKSVWSQSHRDESFAMPRHPNQVPSFARWFVDGKDAYAAMYDTLLAAKKEIFIAGWWICPTIHLLRPAAQFPQSRLDQVLLRKAEEGVKIYILMYKEVSVALTLNSNFSKQVFRRLHDNVHVLRDPDFLMKHLGLWSHHEKIVSVDQKVSFVGGLDLCFGRWDTGDHVLFDDPGDAAKFHGKDYSNPRVKDFVEVHLPDRDMIDRTVVPRMPWHDCHARLEGQPARDVARHFIQRWNYSVSTRRKTSYLHHLVPMKDYERFTDKREYGSTMLNRRLQRAVRAVQTVNGLRKAASTLAPHGEAEEEEKDEEKLGRKTSAVQPQDNPADDDSGHPTGHESPRTTPTSSSADRRGFDHDHHLSRVLSRDKTAMTPFRVLNDDASVSSYASSDLSDNDNEQDAQDEAARLATRGYPVNAQILRSLSLWSGGCPTERSIQNAYLRLIGSANHFVYIENQFFVSGLDGDALCSNRIANALVERIRKAAANKEKFRVMVVMPLLPAFPGKPDDKDASSLRGVMYWQYRSICRGEHSIYHTLFKDLDGLDPFEYIAFYGLRTHSLVSGSGQPTTEEVYVHSKIMIVDDRSCIIGSANINERSMTGDRDSEVAVLIDDTDLDDSVRIAGGTASVGKFAHSFRMKLFEEHFGVAPGSELYELYTDPVSYHAWFAMQDHAMKNCQLYDNVFGCLPSDSITSFKQISLHMLPSLKRDGLPLPAKVEVLQPSPNGRASTTNNPTERTFGSPVAKAAIAAAVATGGAGDNAGGGLRYNDVEPEVVSPSNSSSSSSSSASIKQQQPQQPVDGVVSLAREESSLSDVMTANMRESSQIARRKDELRGVMGQIVYFPLKFLVDEALEPKLFPAELFQ